MSDINERVKGIVAQHLGIDGAIADSASFINDLGADSLDTVELVMALEREFDIEIADEEAGKFDTIQDVVNFIAAETQES